MATLKNRINISVSKESDRALTALAKRDRVPLATKAAELLNLALELEEDSAWDALARARDTKGVRFLTHEEVWK